MARIFESIKINQTTLSNRLIFPPLATAKSTSNGEITQAVLDYYNEKSADNAIGLIIIEHSYVLPEGQAGENQLSVSRDSDVDGLMKIATVIHNNGGKAIMQINHAGNAAKTEITGYPVYGPSNLPHPSNQKETTPLTEEAIKKIVEGFTNAAKRVKAAGFDGVEIHAAHGYLLSQFLSPITNDRTDQYGGSLENRFRLHIEIIHAVRAAVGPKFMVFLRLGASDYREGGTTLEDSLVAVQAFEAAGIDALDISGGFTGYNIGSKEQGYFHPLTEAIKKVVDIPVMLTGGIVDGIVANQLLEEGKADLIGVGRSIFKDSKWAVNAIKEVMNK